MHFYISPAQNWEGNTRVELHELKPGYRIRAWGYNGVQFLGVVTEKLRGGQWLVDLMMIGN